MPELNATFQPQQWIHDNAVDSDHSSRFDAAPAFLELNFEQMRHVVREVLESRHDIDILAEKSGLVGTNPGQHDGPFYIDIDEADLEQFLSTIGISDITTMTEVDWQTISRKEQHAVRHKIIGDALENGFIDVGYRLIQDAMGIDDGGFASTYDSDTRVDYGSIFADLAGAPILRTIYDAVGRKTFVERLGSLNNAASIPSIDKLPDDPSPDDISSLAAASADRILAHVKDIFPNVPDIETFRSVLHEHASRYAQAELSFRKNHVSSPI